MHGSGVTTGLSDFRRPPAMRVVVDFHQEEDRIELPEDTIEGCS